MKGRKEEPESVNAVIIETYMQSYSPAERFGQGVSIITTADIISNLSDMADVTAEEVNAVLYGLGYRLGHNPNGSFGWMIEGMIG